MKPIVKVPAVNGLIAGVLGAILNILLFYFGKHPLLIPPYFDYRIILMGIFIFFTLKEFRDNYQDGILYFWQGLIGSFLFTTAFGLTAALIIYVFALMEPKFLEEYIRLFTEFLKAWPPEEIERLGKNAYERNLEQLPATNAFDLALQYFLQSYAIGFFISIILSVILRRQPKL